MTLFFISWNSPQGAKLPQPVPGLTGTASTPGTSGMSSASLAVDKDFGKTPLYFIPNKGQMDGRVSYYAWTSTYTLWVTKTGLVFDRRGSGSDSVKKRDVSRFCFVNANSNPGISPVETTSYRVNYFKGRDRSQWKSQIPTSKAILYENLYQDIDLKVYGIEKEIEYDWVVKPGGNPGDIRFRYEGVESCVPDEKGDLMVRTAGGQWVHKRPIGYQVVEGQKRPVEVSFAKSKGLKNTYGFRVGAYDKNYPLVIDPMVIAFTSYLGGGDSDFIAGMVVDGSGSVIVTGNTDSSNFPVLNGWDEIKAGSNDGFVTKFTPDGTGLVFSTFVGGNSSDGINSVDSDASGIYIGGGTGSSDFPTLNAFQGTIGGVYNGDGFVCKLSADGSGLIYSSYLGGSGNDGVEEIAVNTNGELYIVGSTESMDFPLQDPIQSTRSGENDLFVTKLSASGSSLVYSTLLGGSNLDNPGGIAIDGSGCAYVTGATNSIDFPTVNAFQPSNAGEEDGFVLKMSADGSSLIYSTYLGGNLMDGFNEVKVDSTGAAYLVGNSYSSDYPTTPNAFQPTLLNGGAVITKLSPSGSGLVYSTFLEGYAGPLCLYNGSVYIAGGTNSYDFPLVDPFKDQMDEFGEMFIAQLSPDGSSLTFSSFVSNSEFSSPSDIAADGSGNIYLAGSTSDYFPAYRGFQNTFGGGNCDGFVTKLVPSQYSRITVTSPNGGEYWIKGSTQTITWTAPDITENVKITHYYYDEIFYNLHEVTVAASAPNTGSYTWTLPNISNSSCTITIEDTSSHVLPDNSDGNFTISSSPFITIIMPNGGEELTAGSVSPIGWYYEGIIGPVSIEYSIDGGNSWISIAADAPGNLLYEWTVPDTPSTDCLVRVTDPHLSLTDTSDALFTILPPSTITVTAPNGGESWIPYSTYAITWISPDDVSNVSIDYSIDNGNSWTTIVSSETNTGSYSWTVPNTPSTNCLVRVNEVGGTLTDTSDAVFTILPPGPITVTAPNGGESWTAYSTYAITWTSPANVSDVSIDYSTDNGNSWTTIVSSETNTGSYSWTVPNTPSTNCLIRVSEVGGTLTDTSDAVFTIIPYVAPFIRLTSPNGGEHWSIGITHDITWTDAGTISDVALDYSTDNGNSWTSIIASVTNTNSYDWTPPNTLSTNCLVRVSQVGGTLTDTSDAVFTLGQWTPFEVQWSKTSGGTSDDYIYSMQQTSDGGYIMVGDTKSFGAGASDVYLVKTDGNGNEQWSKTFGGTNTDTGYSVQKTNDGGYIITGYTLSSAVGYSDVYLIKTDSYGNMEWSKNFGEVSTSICGYSVQQTSDGGYISVGRRTYSGSSVYTCMFLIKTDSYGNEIWRRCIGNTRFDYGRNVLQTSDGGYIIAAQLTDWSKMGLIKVDSEGIKIWSQTYDGGVGGFDKILQQTPDGGYVIAGYKMDEFNTSDAYLVKTDSLGNVEWSKTYGGAAPNIAKAVALTSDGGYIITGVMDFGSGIWDGYLVKTDSLGNQEWYNSFGGTDMDLGQSVVENSDGGYTVAGSTKSFGAGLWDGYLLKFVDPSVSGINLVAPNGGENWEGGTSRDITWTYMGIINHVRIEYSTDNGGSWNTITASTDNSGTYNWTVPNTSSTTCLVKVSDADGTTSDTSDVGFTITDQRTISVTAPNGGESWEGSTANNITWTSTGAIANVKLEYSTDNGSSWTTITDAAANSGTFNWTVPNSPSATCLVRVTDTAGSTTDSSDAVFTIASQRTLTVTAPNGGEAWEGSTAHIITWTSTGSIANVKLEYSTNNGSSWATITDSTSNSGTYNWTVPNSPSTTCLVRVTDIAGTATDTSDATFTITTQRTITVTAPNGGESWEGTTAHDITWTSTGSIANVKLEYSTTNGSSWNTITDSTANSGTFNWTVPNSPSTTCLVRVTDAAGTAADTGDTVFTIAAQRTITLTAPNGGESWEGTTAHNITWTSTGSIPNVKLEYSTTNGSSWTTITDSTANSGTFNWTVPNSPSTTCLVRVTDAADTITDSSDTVFTIAAQRTITLTAPNGGESWEGTTAHNIIWTSTGSIANVKLEYSTTNGSSWTTITDSIANSGTFNWTVPNSPSTTCLVRVTDAAGTATDSSDAAFTITTQRTITVTAPNGGESWEGSTAHNITWTSTGSIANVKLEYSTTSGSSWTTITDSTTNSGTFNWTVPNSPSTTCLVRITDTAGTATDTSDAVFTIVSQRTVTVTTPNGGESWEGTTAHNIIWTSTGSIANVKLEYSITNGSSWTTITDSIANSGTFNWTVPNSPSTTCLVRVTDAAGTATDSSDAAFIIAAQRTLTLTAPNGGETWEGTTAHPITWTSTGSITNVKLEYSTTNGSSWTTITDSTTNSGTFNWTVPNSPSTTCLVRVIDAAGTATDTGDAVFTITTQRTITVTKPNGGQRWFIDSTRTITWTSTGSISNVMIEYSINSGSSWTTIIASTSNTGTYDWIVSNTPSANCLVRVSDTSGTASDVSDSVFTIDPYPTVTVTAPNGGETWIANTTHAITWTYTGTISTVNLEYSTNNGSSWTSIAGSVTNSGSYNWVIPYVSSTTCLVRVSDTATTSSDTSNAVFTIELPPSLTVTSPNGGESWAKRSTHNITWTWTGTVGNVKILYTMNAGSSWTTITSSTANDGSHSWTLPNVTSNKTQCLVKIEAINGSAVDTSNAYFTILK